MSLELIHADCMDIMPRYADNHFDLAIVDPQYGIGADRPTKKADFVTQKNGSKCPIRVADYGVQYWDISRPTQTYFEFLYTIARNQIIFGVNYDDLNVGPGRIVWDKMNNTSDQYGCEIAYNSCNNRTDIVHYMWNGMLQGEVASRNISRANRQIGDKSKNETRIHPTQKPVALYKWLLHNYAQPGQKILDTHGGSGSIAIACHYFGCDLVWIEKDKDYFEAAKARIEKETRQLDMGF